MKNSVELYKPAIKRKDLEYVLNSMIEDKIDNGEFAQKFENKLSQKTGIKKSVTVNSFYSAINLIFDALEIKAGDEVILPAFAPQIYLNVITAREAVPVLVDLESDFFKPSIEDIKSKLNEKTKAIILIYYFGFIYDPTPYTDLSQNIIEDISSIIGCQQEKFQIGINSRFAIADFSIKGLITTGEGGAVFYSNIRYTSILKKYIEDKEYSLDYNPRVACLMPDLNAAMGISQLEHLKHRMELKTKINTIYEEAVRKSRCSMITQDEVERYASDFPLIVKNSLKNTIEYFKKNKVEVSRPYEYPLHHYLDLPKEEFPNTEYFYLHTILIPVNSTLLKKQVNLISKIIASIV